MKKFFVLLIVIFSFTFITCDSAINETLYDNTVGKDKEKTAPGEVTDLVARSAQEAIVISWTNPSDSDFYGVTISMTPEFGALSKPISFKNTNRSAIPESFVIDKLTYRTDYTINVKTFDYNNNESAGINITAAPERNDRQASDDLTSIDDSVFSYKRDKLAVDFGYAFSPVTKTFKFTVTEDNRDFSVYTLENMKNEAGAGKCLGSFEVVEITNESGEAAGTMSRGDELNIKIKYKPSATPSWDEYDLKFTNSSLVLRLIGSSFKQPGDLKVAKDSKEYGLCMWLRADMISESDLTSNNGDNTASVFPDYAPRASDHAKNSHSAYSTGLNNSYAPIYKPDNAFNDMPYLKFQTKSQMVSCGDAKNSPILNSAQGSTTFIVLRSDNSNVTQYIFSANNGDSYPSLMETYRYYDKEYGYSSSAKYGWGIRGYGLYGNSCIRYPFTEDKNDKKNTEWYRELSTVQNICMEYNAKTSSTAVPGTKGWDYPSNISMYVNGQEKLIGYMHSNNTYSDNPADNKSSLYPNDLDTTCYGAYGGPIGDGKGHRYLYDDYKIPSTYLNNKKNGRESSTPNDEIKVYEKWNKIRVDSKNDYSLSITPASYKQINSSKEEYKQNNRGYSVDNYNDGANGGAYFYNWISTDQGKNNNIYSILLGGQGGFGTPYTYFSIAEVIMFDYPLSADERKIVDNYIFYRYGIGSEK